MHPEDSNYDEKTPRLNFKAFLIESLARMKAHESTEKEESIISDDKTLIGLITLNNDLLHMFI